MKHTPGPWKISSPLEVGGCRDISAPSVPEGIAGTYGLNDDAEDAANAILIMASPKLLKALEDLHDSVDNYNASPGLLGLCSLCGSQDYDGNDIVHKPKCPLLCARLAIAEANRELK